jgi:signal transduction histidine kinase
MWGTVTAAGISKHHYNFCMQKNPLTGTRPQTGSTAPAGRSTRRAQGQRLFQACVVGMFILVLAIFLANYPAGLTPWRFGATAAGLLLLLGLNVVGIDLLPRARTKIQILKDWLFLVLSGLLILGVVGASGQYDLVYLLSLVCIQADANQGVWPGGALFSGAILLAWLGLQLAFGIPLPMIAGREMALAVGVAFGLVVVILLQRTTRQTERAEALLTELQAANRELEAARQKDRELAIAEERLRLARELHDSVTQSLYSVGLYAEAAAEQLHAGSTGKVSEHLQELQETAQAALREMRLLIFELRRPALEQGGLAAALRARLEAVEARGGMETELQVEGQENLPAETQTELYGILLEALNNSLKHAHAQRVGIRLEFRPDLTRLEIHDDGTGFDTTAGRPGGFGMAGMKERARKIGGRLQVESSPGSGTHILVQVPGGPAENPE